MFHSTARASLASKGRRAPKPKRLPTAEQQTLSLFTRLTDLESSNARDGSRPSPVHTSRPIRRPPIVWIQSAVYEWRSEKAPYVIERSTKGVYTARKGMRELGRYPSIIDAGRAVERDARGAK